MPWFLDRLRIGHVDIENPYNNKKSRIDLCPESVHSIVFWSKNYGPFIAGKYEEMIKSMGYGMFFQFTVNPPSSLLESGVPSIDERLGQAAEMARMNPDAMEWRFDPICYYQEKNTGTTRNNLSGFDQIAAFMAGIGIKRCVTSFLDIYAKLKKREAAESIRFIDPDIKEKIRTIELMEGVLKKLGMTLRLCCEADLGKELSGLVTPGGCIDGELLMKIHGGNISKKPDKGQRLSGGCACTESRDIGSYRSQPCFHKCLYCYAS